MYNLAISYRDAGQNDRALNLFEESLALAGQSSVPTTPIPS